MSPLKLSSSKLKQKRCVWKTWQPASDFKAISPVWQSGILGLEMSRSSNTISWLWSLFFQAKSREKYIRVLGILQNVDVFNTLETLV